MKRGAGGHPDARLLLHFGPISAAGGRLWRRYADAAVISTVSLCTICGVSTGLCCGVGSGRRHYERPPFNDKTQRSFYHVREFEVFQMSQLAEPIDLFLSHDWPRGIARFGNKEALLRKKKFLREEVVRGLRRS